MDPVDKSEYTQRANELGWDVFQVPATNKHGLPLLKPMYAKIMDTYNATFYAYSNGDIIYDIGLVKTLTFLKSNLSSSSLVGVLIVGRRTNYYHEYPQNVLYTSDEVHKLGSKQKQFVVGAVDYFIIKGKSFPFHELPDFVVGRCAYDNYMIALALHSGFTGIDITATALALHQDIHLCQHEDGKKGIASKYNKDMIESFRKMSMYIVNMNVGRIDFMPFYTYLDKDSKVDIRRRDKPLSYKKIEIRKKVPG